jgi:hypothetical protein
LTTSWRSLGAVITASGKGVRAVLATLVSCSEHAVRAGQACARRCAACAIAMHPLKDSSRAAFAIRHSPVGVFTARGASVHALTD